MSMRHSFAIIALALLLGGCVEELLPVFPDPNYEEILAGTIPVPDSAKRRIEGVYEVLEGDQRFGTTVVLKYSGGVLSVFSERNVAFMILRGGVRDSTIVYTGTWRFAQDVSTGRVELSIAADEGASALLDGDSVRPVTTLRGLSGGPNANSQLNSAVVLRYLRPVRRRIQGFWNIAHRGGGRNSDRHPYSENSIPMLLYASQLGANGVEIDIRLTKDGIPILFHDAEFTTRLVHGNYMTGPVGNYTYAQMQTYARLRNGEQIPTLAEALDTIIRSTDLRLVWLDVKEPAAVPAIIALIRSSTELARSLGREIEILHGIPDEEILAAYLVTDHAGIGAICELGPEETRRAEAVAWAPRWTLGTVNDEVAAMHAEGRRAFVWTLDQPTFIAEFLRDGDFDGILTNYPTLVAYYAYSQQ
jgi:glycerophosphoryl diester phosphodiesterase